MRRAIPGEGQLELNFAQQIEAVVVNRQAIWERAHGWITLEPSTDGRESEAEFHIELAVACKKAITDSGMSREEVVDRINEYFGRPTGEDDKSDRRGHGPLTINMLNNYFSDSKLESPLPTRVVRGICVVTGNSGPAEVFLSGLGFKVIDAGEQTDLLLGKLESESRELAKIRRDLVKIQESRGRL
jgi:hypothetical protein